MERGARLLAGGLVLLFGTVGADGSEVMGIPENEITADAQNATATAAAEPRFRLRGVFAGFDWSVEPVAEAANYVLFNSHPFFGDGERTWVETSVRFGAVASFGKLRAGAAALALMTNGHDPYGTFTRPAGTPAGTPGDSRVPVVYLDEAYLQATEIAGLPLTLTVGRQPITIGSQFLIGDGVYDGFTRDTQQAVFHSPRRGFDAVRLRWDDDRWEGDAFVYRVDPTWAGGGADNSFLGGMDLSRHFEAVNGTYAAGMYYRYASSDLDNTNAILNVRGDQHLPAPLGDPYVSGEVVYQFAGTCRNPSYCVPLDSRMSEVAWHAEARYRFDDLPFRPFVEAGYVYYSPSFTPIATGFSEWGKWYLGNQIDWILFATNAQIARATLGAWPRIDLRTELLYHHTRQVEPTGTSSGGPLSDEVALVVEWFPLEWLWLTFVAGYSVPGAALAQSGLMNPFQSVNSGAVAIGDTGSFDTLFALGVQP